IKPLYYTNQGQSVFYSSEVKSFFACGLAGTDIDEVYAAHRYVFGFGPVGRTLFAEVRAVEPGTYVEVRLGGVHVEHYAMVSDRPIVEISSENTAERIRDLLAQSVSAQIPREVRWGIFLSGGVDSTILSWLAARENRENCQLFTMLDDSETSDL